MDDLQKAFDTYKSLLEIEYHIIVGKKGKLTNYIIRFDKDHFKHTFGFHKLKDNESIYKTSSSRLYRDVSTGRITLETLKKSQYYHDIETRIQNIAYLDVYLDTTKEFYRWNQNKSPFSVIAANIMIPNKSKIDETNEVFIFFNKNSNDQLIFTGCIEESPISIIQPQLDYRIGQERSLSILLMEKYNKSLKSKEELFRAKTFDDSITLTKVV